ncbi:MAG TPA: NAD(P)-binding domain-containing protein [Chthoniobacterales bacterium]|nr:NAD(P)-binding domain-containing protein [Chthoniobacterales bacterium]
MPGIIERYTKWLHTQWPAGTVEKLPVSGPEGITAQPGVRIVGDLTGIPLLKFSSHTGAQAVRAIVRELEPARPRAAGGAAVSMTSAAGGPAGSKDDVLDLAIIGAGVAGISAAIEAKKAGLNFAVFEATEIFSTVVNFPKAKPIYTYPTEMELDGGLQFSADVKETLLEEMEAQRRAAGIEVTRARIERIESRGRNELLLHKDDKTTLTARRAIVAIGRSGNFRKLDVPGEELDKVYNRLFDPKEFAGQNSLVVGGGDSALETAIALATCGSHVTLSYRRKELSRAKPANIEKVEMLVRDASADVQVEKPTSERVNTAVTDGMRGQKSPGSLKLALGTQVTRIERGRVYLKNGTDEAIPNDVVFTMLGREAPLEFFRRSGIPIAGEGTLRGWSALGIFLAFCTFVYAWKSGGFAETWLNPFPENMPSILGSLGGWFQAQVADRSTLLGTLAVSLKSRSFYYTLAYSTCIVVFGITRIRRRRTPYVTWQTIVLMLVQVVPLFLLPEIILPYLGYNGWFDQGFGKAVADRLFESYIPEAQYLAQQWPDWGHPRAYWRAYGFILAWPLMVYNVFTDAPLTWWLIIAFIQTFVLIPAMIWRWGKGAYCGWICSCGALAETMGDKQRHKMPHGPFWNRLNMAGQVILAVAFLLLAVRILGWIWPQSIFASAFQLLLDGKNNSGKMVNYASYKWFVDVFLGGIIGVGLYFKYSGRVWCRFFCPLAALMHIYARFSRFRIFPEKAKCISCNVCTSVCHQGIDIMNFANKGLPMQDPECVRCSACVQQCPTGVLAFGRYDGERRIVLDKIPASPVRMREGASA